LTLKNKMACVTLKRPLDFDPLEALHSPNRPTHAKRRRCTPIKKLESREPFLNPAVGKIPTNLGGGSASLALYRSGQAAAAQTAGIAGGSGQESVFRETPLSPNEMADNLRDELKRMKKRKQLAPYFENTTHTSSSSAGKRSPIHSAPGSPEPMDSALQKSGASAGVSATSSALPIAETEKAACSSSRNPALSAKALVGTKDKPVFTLKQMTIICERMCQERTDKVRQEYDQILQQKLSEQYDAFVKFIDHQVQQRFNQSQLPSYLS